MDQYPPSEPNQAPEAPVTPPPHQPYQPPQAQPSQPQQYPPQYQQPPTQPGYPPQGYQQPGGQQYPPQGYQQPPTSQPYQQPGYQPGPGYAPMPPPPAQQKKGFNWLACLGIACGGCLILVIIFGIGMYKFVQHTMEWTASFDDVSGEVQAASTEQIRADAVFVDPTVLSQNPETYKDQWIAVEGVITGDVPANTSYQMGQYGTQDTTTYMLDGNVIVMDMTQTPAVGQTGDMIRAYGKVAIFDMSSMPVFGKFMEQVMQEAVKNDPNAQDVPMKMIFVYTKDVELVLPETDGTDGGEDVKPPWEQPKW